MTERDEDDKRRMGWDKTDKWDDKFSKEILSPHAMMVIAVAQARRKERERCAKFVETRMKDAIGRGMANLIRALEDET